MHSPQGLTFEPTSVFLFFSRHRCTNVHPSCSSLRHTRDHRHGFLKTIVSKKKNLRRAKGVPKVLRQATTTLWKGVQGHRETVWNWRSHPNKKKSEARLMKLLCPRPGRPRAQGIGRTAGFPLALTRPAVTNAALISVVEHTAPVLNVFTATVPVNEYVASVPFICHRERRPRSVFCWPFSTKFVNVEPCRTVP